MGYNCEASGVHAIALGYRANAQHNGAIVIADSASGIGLAASDTANQLLIRASGGTKIYSTRNISVGGAGVELTPGSGSWASLSDRDSKENFRSVDGEDLLARISQLEISRWNYRTQDSSIEHIGPMAQDFYRLFSVGDNDKTITSVDPDGIALAAIQELHKRNIDLTERNARLEAQMAELRRRIDALSGEE
jgi:hypothetical protein